MTIMIIFLFMFYLKFLGIYNIIWEVIFRIRVLTLKVRVVNIVYTLNEIKYINLKKNNFFLKFT